MVFSPYGGIGSEGHIALGGKTRAGRTVRPRKFVGVELKGSYYRQAVPNLLAAAGGEKQLGLFADAV